MARGRSSGAEVRVLWCSACYLPDHLVAHGTHRDQLTNFRRWQDEVRERKRLEMAEKVATAVAAGEEEFDPWEGAVPCGVEPREKVL